MKANPNPTNEFLTAHEAADLACVSVQTIYQKVRQGVIPGRQMGGKKSRYVIPKASFLRYLEGVSGAPANAVAAPSGRERLLAVSAALEEAARALREVAEGMGDDPAARANRPHPR